VRGTVDRIYKTLQIKNTKLYTFEIWIAGYGWEQKVTLFHFIYQNLVSVNPIFELKMRVLGVDSGVWVI
jgi:hypothetical protein